MANVQIPLSDYAKLQINEIITNNDETDHPFEPAKEENEILIKPVQCYNDFVALLQSQIKSSIDLQDKGFTNEGIVIGVGPGLPTASGERCPSQLNVGDVVSYFGNPVTVITPAEGTYAGKRVIVINERSVMCKLQPVKFTILENQ